MTQESTNIRRRAASSTPKEASIESYLVKRVSALGGFALKGDIPGVRFLDRICIMPDGVTLWIECKRTRGGRRTRLQENVIKQLLNRGHFAFFVKTREEVDAVLDGTHVFYDGKLFIGRFDNDHFISTPKGLVRPAAVSCVVD